MTTYTRKAFWGFVWIATSLVIANLFGYLLRLLLARNLTVAEYGTVFAVLALFGLVELFHHLGLGQAITKYITKYSVSGDEEKVRDIVVWSARIMHLATLPIAIIFFFAADWLAAAYLGNPGSAILIRIYALGFLFLPAGTLFPGFFAGLQRMDIVSIFKPLRAIIIFILAWVFLAQGMRAQAPIIAYVIAFFALYVLTIILIRVFVPLSWKTQEGVKVPRMLLAFGLPVMLTGIAGTILAHTDTALIAIFSTLSEVGLYQAALPTANILLFFKGTIMTVLLPLVSELWEKKEMALITMAVNDLYAYAYILFLPLSLAVIIFPDVVLNLLFGSEFIAAAIILQVLAAAGIFLTLNTVNAATLSGIGVPKEVTIATFAGASLNLILNLFLIPLMGGLGAAISTLLAALLIFSFTARSIAKHVQVTIPWTRWLKTTVAGAIFVAIIFVFRIVDMQQYAKIAVALVCAGGVYALALLAMRAVTIEDIKVMKDRILPR